MGLSIFSLNSFKNERGIILLAMVILSILAWWYTIYLAHTMNCCAFALKAGGFWSAQQFGLMFVMWVVMMVAMMVPTIVPMVLVFAMVNRKRHEQAKPYVPTSFFILGYLIVWIIFSLLATFMQEWLQARALLSMHMVLNHPMINGSILILAGIFQWTPLKNKCLTHCRSPFDFIMTDWRQGAGGAIMMGLRHGTFCLGCCWLLMLLLFVGGVMNIAWIVFLTVFVLGEKVFPYGHWISRGAGAIFFVWGLVILLSSL
jgi:predicted metal-binding membrane protein